MANTQSVLIRFSSAHKALEAHKSAHKEVYDVHNRLGLAILDAENELRDAVAETKEGASDDNFKVTYYPQTQTFADIEVLKAKEGQTLTPALIAEIIKTVDRPPRITITPQTRSI